jgi:hypothetical protein
MTRISGEKIIETACCGAEFRTPAYSSINLSALERWTDGRVVGSLFDNGGGLRRCTCGSYYLLSNAVTVGTIPKSKPRAPQNWERKSASWWHLFWGFPTLEHILVTYDTRDSALIEEEEKQLPPHAFHVVDSELADVISSPKLSAEIEIIARRRYWRYLNDSYREIYRRAREIDPMAMPSYEPSLQQRENMERLLSLFDSHHTQDWTEMAELLRELGEPAAAHNALKYANNSQAKDVDLQNHLINQGVQAPVRFRY